MDSRKHYFYLVGFESSEQVSVLSETFQLSVTYQAKV